MALINGRFMGVPITGVQRFAREILLALDRVLPEHRPGVRVLMAVPPGILGTHQAMAFQHIDLVEVGRRQGHAWEQLELSRFSPDLPLVSLCNTAPLWRQRQSVVIHDAAVFSLPQAYSRKFRLAYKALHHGLARTGAKLLTVSEFSKQDLARHLHVPSKAIGVLPESGEHMLRLTPDDTILDKHDLRQRPFVLAVSSNHMGKNFAFVAEALLTLERQQGNPGFDVVVAGGSNSTVFAQRGTTLPSFIKRVGYVSDEQLCSLYQHATCFVFPSVYEGFGLPPLEAMSLGCPVLASDAASIPEVCGDAAMYFQPHDASTLLKALQRVMIADEKNKRAWRERSLQHSQQWTWDRAARTLLQHMEE